jgi:hypothetical protein
LETIEGSAAAPATPKDERKNLPTPLGHLPEYERKNLPTPLGHLPEQHV